MLIEFLSCFQKGYCFKNDYELNFNKNICLLYGLPQYVSNTKWGRKAIHYYLLGSANTPLVLCEGIDDEKFYQTLGQFFGVNMNNFVIKPGDGLVAHFKLVIDAVRQIGANREILVLLDKDFRIKQQTRESEGLVKKEVSLICTDLPSIESYLFIHFMKRGYFSLDFVKNKNMLNSFASRFMDGFVSQNKKKKDKKEEASQQDTNVSLKPSKEEEKEVKENEEDLEENKEEEEEEVTFNVSDMFIQWNEAMSVAEKVLPLQQQVYEARQKLRAAKKKKETSNCQ
jgi:hypothetical protein